MPDLIIPSLSEDEYESAGSKFAKAGAHLSECGMPEWETPGQSIRFPFTITEEGEDKGKESKLVAGVSKAGIWKFKEMEKALGLQIMEPVDGKMTIKEANLLACVGKSFQSVWTLETDSRTPEQGGKGGTYTKPTSALPVGANVEDLGI